MSLKEALAGIKQGQADTEPEHHTRKLQRSDKTKTARATGKSANEAYERLTVYVLKTTKRDAGRKWEDATGQDMSDLVEKLLFKYLNT